MSNILMSRQIQIEIDKTDALIEELKGKIVQTIDQSESDLNSEKFSYVLNKKYLEGAKNAYSWFLPRLIQLETELRQLRGKAKI